MPRLSDYLNKPEYAFRPSQAARRIWRGARATPVTAEVLLPWGFRLRIRPGEMIGRAIWTTGVYDLAVSELLWRLTDPGETAVDAGANIGYMTSILAARVGPAGAVYAFEPHPDVAAELCWNAELWDAGGTGGRVHLRRVGLSDVERDAVLVEGDEFVGNRGAARVGSGDASGRSIRLTTLDGELGRDGRIGVLKVDVEGHEGPLLRGARRLLSTRAVRDVVYEEFPGEQAEATSILRSHGYVVFGLRKRFIGPALTPPAPGGVAQAWMVPSYLATVEPERAVSRLRARGWRCLRGSD